MNTNQEPSSALAVTPRSAFVTLVGYPRESLAGRYLQGPRDPKEVKRNGYGFTHNADEAWPFASERKASAKARIVERHMGWGEGVMIVEPQACSACGGRGTIQVGTPWAGEPKCPVCSPPNGRDEPRRR